MSAISLSRSERVERAAYLFYWFSRTGAVQALTEEGVSEDEQAEGREIAAKRKREYVSGRRQQ
jgi:hypothetical protein